MKIGDLVKCRHTGRAGIVIWAGSYGTHFKVSGFPINQVFNSHAWERLSEGR
jgi:hypothetical protein